MAGEKIVTFERARDIVLLGLVRMDRSSTIGVGRVDGWDDYRNDWGYSPEIIATEFGCMFVYDVTVKDGQMTEKKGVKIENETLDCLIYDMAGMGSAVSRTRDGVMVGMERDSDGVSMWVEVGGKKIICSKSKRGLVNE